MCNSMCEDVFVNCTHLKLNQKKIVQNIATCATLISDGNHDCKMPRKELIH